MFSLQDHIDNPMRIPDYLHMEHTVESWKCPRVHQLTQEQYDLIKIHEPNTMYYITDAGRLKVYMGDQLIPEEKLKCKYLLGSKNVFDKPEYSLYMVIENDGRTDLVEIAVTNNLHDAVQLMNTWNKTGYHHETRGIIRQGLVSYIRRENSAHEFIVNILAMFGYRNDPRLQDVINTMTVMGASKGYKFDNFASEQLEYLKKHPNNSVYKRYSNLYDLLVKYDWFRGPEYQKDDVDLEMIDLTAQIDEIVRIMQG